MLKTMLSAPSFDYIRKADKVFILAFDQEMEKRGYTSNQAIGDGYCWGKHMIIYTKQGVKSKKSYARVYIREDHLVLRMYFSNVDRQAEFVASAPAFIREAFTGTFGACGHCHNQKEDGACVHRKSYVIHGTRYEKCDGMTFWYMHPDISRLSEYLKLFAAFYPEKTKR